MGNTSDSFMPGPLLFCMKIERSVCYKVTDNNMSRSCTYVSRNSAKHKCIVFCRVLKRKEYINDIRKTCKSEVQIWKQTFLVSWILCRYGREKCKENTGIYSKSVTG